MESGDNGSGYYCEPLWIHVDILEESDQLDEDHVKFLCDYCNRVFHGNYSKVEEHFLKMTGRDACIGVTNTIRAQLESEVAAAKDLNGRSPPRQDLNGRSPPRQVPLTQSGTSSYSGCMSVTGKAVLQPKKRMKTTDLDDDFCVKLRTILDAIIARLFYSSGLPFSVAMNPHYQSTFSLATGKKDTPGRTDGDDDSYMENQKLWNEQIMKIFLYSDLPFSLQRNPYYHAAFSLATCIHIPGYVPPGPDELKTTLLKQERAHIERLLETIKSTWRNAGVTIVCDGWSDAERRPVINTLAVTESGPVFLNAIYNEDKVKRKDYIAKKLIAAIEDVGPENVVQVITDNDPICRDAGMLIEERYNHIHWIPSVAHTLSLVLKQICAAMNTENVALKDCQWISEVVDAAHVITKFHIGSLHDVVDVQ
ncbi:hypothetical protein PR202_gb01246 [Eleusine coracana subsp. coracana]|uniref:DUF659 domain-containing protein n=1 Tax=Eleusine coracana subsp. coracana TaxID=191504 RepID=A0AAV5DVT3_ELECO|nr:hypothetical protein PR202_gb01246 [Eleusine coracana subsp. coracana]